MVDEVYSLLNHHHHHQLDLYMWNYIRDNLKILGIIENLTQTKHIQVIHCLINNTDNGFIQLFFNYLQNNNLPRILWLFSNQLFFCLVQQNLCIFPLFFFIWHCISDDNENGFKKKKIKLRILNNQKKIICN